LILMFKCDMVGNPDVNTYAVFQQHYPYFHIKVVQFMDHLTNNGLVNSEFWYS
jgi:hypothetical protein